MGNVIRLAAMATPIQKRAQNRMSDNRRTGYVVCWRSLLDAEWARNTIKLAAWLRLIGQAAYEAGTVRYKGRDWHLLRGQLVVSSTELGQQLRDERGRALDKKAIGRVLAWFEQEGMITLNGTPWGTVITLNNYDDYQAALQPVASSCESLSNEQFEGGPTVPPIGSPIGPLTVPPNAAPAVGLSGDAVPPTVPPIGAPTVTTTEQELNKYLNTEDLKQISCPVSDETGPAKARRSEHAVNADAKAVLDHFNATSASRYQAKPTSLQNINARLAEGYTVAELQLVAEFKAEHWGGDLKMAEYLRPMTVFAPQKFAGYLAAAQRWVGIGRPRCVNGEWEGYGRQGKGLSNLAAAQQAAMTGGVRYDDDAPL